MEDFFSGANFLWIIGIISGIVGGIWAFYKFVYEQKLERFKEANAKIFSDNEDDILTAVANLGVFKRDFMFERNTVDVLLTRLYKELNYNITNAITNALIQFSNRRELLYIANEILGINRNFFFQTQPYKDMLGDINSQYQKLKQSSEGQTDASTSVGLIEKEKSIIDKKIELYTDKYMKLNEKVSYELLWHKQITADTYARIIRRAAALKMPPSITFLNYLKQVILSWDFRFYGRKVPLELYQNAFSFIHLVQFETTTCEMKRSGFENAIIADVTFNNIRDIYDCVFQKASLLDCVFNKGRIRLTNMVSVVLTKVDFKKIEFIGIYFTGSVINNCSFEECKGLSAASFYGAQVDDRTRLPAKITRENIAALTPLQVAEEVMATELRSIDKNQIYKLIGLNIKKPGILYDIFNSRLDENTKKEMRNNASPNFNFSVLYNFTRLLKAEPGAMFGFLRWALSSVSLEKLVVELYDSGLAAESLRLIIPMITPKTTAEAYTNAIDKSVLRDEEKDFMKKVISGITAKDPAVEVLKPYSEPGQGDDDYTDPEEE